MFTKFEYILTFNFLRHELLYFPLLLIFFQLVEFIEKFIANNIITSGQFVFHSAHRLFEMAYGHQFMLWISCRSASHQVKDDESLFLRPLDEFPFEEVVSTDVSRFSVGCSIQIDDGLFFMIKQIDASADNRTVW